MPTDEPPGTITDEDRFRAFVAASSDVVYRMSPDWSQMCELQGRSFLRDTAQPSGAWLESYIPAEDRAQVRTAIERAIRSKSVFELQHRVIRADGSIGWTSSRAVPLLDAGGEIQEWVGAARDITAAREVADARAAIEARLRESEALRRVALEGGRMGAWRWDLARRLVRGDAQFLALWGLGPSDDPLPLSLFTDRMSPEGAAEMEVIVTRAIEAGDAFDGPLEIVCGPTAGRWIRWRGRPVGEDSSVLQGVTFDITEQRQAETRLRESEARFRLVADNISQLAWTCNSLGDVNWYNRRWLEYTGLSFEEMGSWGWAKVQHPDHVERVVAGVRRAAASGEPWEDTFPLRRRDGEYRWFYSQAMPIRDQGGEIVQWFGTNTDVTDQRRIEEALRESEARLRLTVELVPALLWRADARGREIQLNEQWLAYTGQTAEQTQDFGWFNAIHSDDLPATRAAFEHAFATGDPLEREHRIHKAGDGYRWHLVRHVPVRDEHDAINHWYGAAVDIHDSKLAKQALDENERLLQTLVEGVPQLVWRASGDGDWTWASPQWTAFTGQAEEDSLGRGCLGTVHPDDREQVGAIWAGSIARGEFHADYRIRRSADGRYRWFQTRATPVRSDKGEIVEWLGTSTDVQDLRGLQDRQQVLLHELQHRVRNTLAIARSIAARTGETSETVEDFASHLEGRLNALARTQMVLTRSLGEGVDLESMVREELLAQAAREAQIEIEGEDVRLSPKAAEVLTLAIHELATNAVKYGALATPAGRIRVGWTVEPRDDESWLRLLWEETGVRMVASAPRRQGFGTELIETRVPYELRGRGALRFRPGGLRCEIEFPLRTRESILQTRAPDDDFSED